MRLETIQIGKIVGTHGVRGEVRVQPRDGDPSVLTNYRTFLLDGQPVTPAVRLHKSLALMKFPDVDDLDTAEALRGKDLYILRADAHLPEGEAFDDELLGLEVYDADTGALLGELTRVDPYPAHKIYTVRGQRTYLIPAVKDVFIKSVDLDRNRMEVRLLEGLAVDGN